MNQIQEYLILPSISGLRASLILSKNSAKLLSKNIGLDISNKFPEIISDAIYISKSLASERLVIEGVIICQPKLYQHFFVSGSSKLLKARLLMHNAEKIGYAAKMKPCAFYCMDMILPNLKYSKRLDKLVNLNAGGFVEGILMAIKTVPIIRGDGGMFEKLKMEAQRINKQQYNSNDTDAIVGVYKCSV